MLGRLIHVAIAVPDLAAASAIYRDTLGAKLTTAQLCQNMASPSSLSTLAIPRSNCWSRSVPDSPIAAFLAKNPSGGMHMSATKCPIFLRRAIV